MTKRLMFLMVFALIAASCSDSTTDTTIATTATPLPESTASTSTTTTTTLSTTTTTTQPATTSEPVDAPEVLVSNPNRSAIDDFDTTGDDLDRIVVELFDLISFLEANPTDSAADMASLLAEPDYPYYDAMLAGLQELVDNPGWRYVDPGIGLAALEITEQGPDIGVARVVNFRGEEQIADAENNVVKTYPPSPLAVNEFTLTRGDDGLWRLADVGPSVAISQDEIDTMVQISWEGRSP